MLGRAKRILGTIVIVGLVIAGSGTNVYANDVKDSINTEENIAVFRVGQVNIL